MIFNKINAIKDNLTDNEKKIVEYLKNNCNDSKIMTSTEIASRINVSQPSVIRLSKKLGYSSFREMLADLPNEEDTVHLYLTACETLEKYGYKQYEISNFSISNMESKHNLKYWNCDEYLGVGPSAHSFINKKRFYYPKSINTFINENKIIYDSQGGDITEYSMLRLRLNKGLENKEFNKKFSCNIPESYYAKTLKYKNTGLIICTDNSIKLTRKGFLVSNELIAEIIL